MRALFLAAALVAAPATARTLDDRVHDLPRSEWVWQGLRVADAAITAECLRHVDCHETSMILGRHPSDAALAGQLVVTGALHAAITSVLQDHAPDAVKVWEIVSIGVGAGVVAHNISVRAKVKF